MLIYRKVHSSEIRCTFKFASISICSVQAVLVESARIAAAQNPPLDVYPYTKFEYNPYQFLDSFYAKVWPMLINTYRIAILIRFYCKALFVLRTHSQRSYFLQKDVCNSLKQAADLGARGVILWSSSKNMKQRCVGLAGYVRDMLGP